MMKWINESNVQFNRGNYESIIAKFDNSLKWFNVDSIASTSTAKSLIRKLAQAYNAKVITIKHLFDENGNPTEKREDVVDFYRAYDEKEDRSYYVFRYEIPVKEGSERKFRYFEESELFAEQ